MAPFDGIIIDGLQYCHWSEKIFRELREGGVTAIHVTIAYHETFREMVGNIATWNRWFERFPDLIFPGRTGADVQHARDTGRTAVFFGFQNPSPIEDEIGLVEICHQLGIRFMQLSYNNQSLLATGWAEPEDTGITRMGREVIKEMNRFGIAIDMSHSAERSTLQAIDLSSRPIAVTHANPSSWREGGRNKSAAVLKALGETGGILGFSLYPHHLKDSSDCSLASFCEMAARTAELTGADHIGIGSDLCQDQPDSVVEWMRTGRWTKHLTGATFPRQPSWFRSNLDFAGIADGLRQIGFQDREIAGIMGENWLRFFERSFGPAEATSAPGTRS
jgi:microsomal dipeptidase-like Zn-dependent dipeptidase